MKLIEEIKKAEETAEKLKKEAHIKGQKLVEGEREIARKLLADLTPEKEELFNKIRVEAQEEVDKRTVEIEKEHIKQVNKLEEVAKKNKKNALKKVQEIILTWPSSQ